jgi:hypothetical protein
MDLIDHGPVQVMNPRFNCHECGRVYFVGDPVFMGLDKCFCGKWCRYTFLRSSCSDARKRATGRRDRLLEYDSFFPAQTGHRAH